MIFKLSNAISIRLRWDSRLYSIYNSFSFDQVCFFSIREVLESDDTVFFFLFFFFFLIEHRKNADKKNYVMKMKKGTKKKESL